MQLNIHQPCHEKWSNMSPSEKGKLCASCQKEVVDFTQFTDQQLIDFFKQQRSGENTCGRLQTHQLNRTLVHYKPTSHWPSITLASVLSLLGITGYAQNTTKLSPVLQQFSFQPEMIETLAIQKQYSLNFQTFTVKGLVIDAESEEPLFVANVVQKGTYNGVSTDVDGNFSITVTTQDSVELSFSFIGYATKTIVFSIDQLQVLAENKEQLVVQLNPLLTTITLGMLITSPPKNPIIRVGQRVKYFFWRIFH
tara:strand:+ start:3013 stop:3768 length:756 start_codon:yes stop_codon:yes gene_type:complete